MKEAYHRIQQEEKNKTSEKYQAATKFKEQLDLIEEALSEEVNYNDENAIIYEQELQESQSDDLSRVQPTLPSDLLLHDNYHREEFISALRAPIEAFFTLKNKYEHLFKPQPIFANIDEPGSSSWYNKFFAGIKILIGAFTGAFLGAALGSLAGPGGTVIGGIKGAVAGGGKAAALTLGSAVLGTGVGAYVPYYFGGRDTLFPPSQEKQVKIGETKPDRNLVTMSEGFETLDTNLPSKPRI